VNFLDQLKIIHDDVVMRLFSETFFRYVAVWFNNLKADSIGSWTKLSNSFSKCWG
jgi:hypothetical protein